MTATKAETERRERLASSASAWVRRAILEAVRDNDGEIVTHPGMLRSATHADGLVAARAIEQQARKVLRDYCRDAREAGMGWRKIGGLLGLQRQADKEGITTAQAAYDLAAPPDSHWAQTYSQTFRWTCRTCGHDIDDEGPEIWPGDFRRGHAKGCQRLAAEVRDLSREG